MAHITEIAIDRLQDPYTIVRKDYDQEGWCWYGGSLLTCFRGECQACHGRHAMKEKEELAEEIQTLLRRFTFNVLQRTERTKTFVNLCSHAC